MSKASTTDAADQPVLYSSHHTIRALSRRQDVKRGKIGRDY